MAITINSIGKRRLVTQIESNLTGLQKDMHNNALTHKAMAQAQSPALAVLQSFVADCAQKYLDRLQWIIDLRNNPTRRQRLVDVLAAAGWAEQEVIDYVTELRNAAIALRDAPRTTYAEIVTACDAMTTTVDKPESLWPE